MDLVPQVAGLFPVGRLDVTTEGLILLTNDGAFAERVSHPRYEVPRVYHAKVHRVPDARDARAAASAASAWTSDFMAVDRVRVIEADNNAWVELTLHEGKQHEVKRLLEAVGPPGLEAAPRRVRAGDHEGPRARRVPLAHARGDRGAPEGRGRPGAGHAAGPPPAKAPRGSRATRGPHPPRGPAATRWPYPGGAGVEAHRDAASAPRSRPRPARGPGAGRAGDAW